MYVYTYIYMYYVGIVCPHYWICVQNPWNRANMTGCSIPFRSGCDGPLYSLQSWCHNSCWPHFFPWKAPWIGGKDHFVYNSRNPKWRKFRFVPNRTCSCLNPHFYWNPHVFLIKFPILDGQNHHRPVRRLSDVTSKTSSGVFFRRASRREVSDFGFQLPGECGCWRPLNSWKITDNQWKIREIHWHHWRIWENHWNNIRICGSHGFNFE